MEFQFHLLSLLIVFLLVIIYYTGKDSFHKKNSVVRLVLLTTYIMQLGYFSTYIMSKNGSNMIWFSKFYFITVILWFALFNYLF